MKKKIFFSITISALVVILVSVMYMYLFNKSVSASRDQDSQKTAECLSSLNLIRENNHDLAHSLFLADVPTESSKYLSMKEDLFNTILKEKEKGKIQSVSVYFRNMDDASWMSIDSDQNYFPGSLMKVPVMIYYLKLEEHNPSVLNRELYFEKPATRILSQNIKGDSIRIGKKYKISELIRYMIVESDNSATVLLFNNMEPESFLKIFRDLGIPPDNLDKSTYEISPREYSKFFRVLYNATYLNKELSEYALELLSKSKFDQGITKKLPSTLTIARKFGERKKNDINDLSESAIVYLGTHPYLLTIMTKGNNLEEQSQLISEISYKVYQNTVNAN